MRLAFTLLFLLTISLGAADKPRLLVTTDIGGDPDDCQSLVRLLMYSNEFEIEGLIASASGTPGELGEAVTRPDMIRQRVKTYGKVLDNLRVHDSDYPDTSTLLNCIKSGNKNRGKDYIGKGHDSEASEFIISVVDKNDPRPLNIAIWGGQTDLAQALWRVRQERSPEELAEFINKIRVYDIADQDGLFSWIHDEFPDVWYILNKAPKDQDKRDAVFRGMYLGGNEDLTSKTWLRAHISQNHGPLGALYPDEGLWTAPNPHSALKEGDTPSWFYFLRTGLNDPLHPEWGGWGGRFREVEPGLFRDAKDAVSDTKSARATVWRWRQDFQNHFAARMDWCIDAPYANHAPNAVVNGDSTIDALKLAVAPGETIYLNAGQSGDPDGDELNFHWWIYPEPGTYPDVMKITDPNQIELSLETPDDLGKKSFHVILKVTDDGEPALTSYRRILIAGAK